MSELQCPDGEEKERLEHENVPKDTRKRKAGRSREERMTSHKCPGKERGEVMTQAVPSMEPQFMKQTFQHHGVNGSNG
jgi:hypothetical protein